MWRWCSRSKSIPTRRRHWTQVQQSRALCWQGKGLRKWHDEARSKVSRGVLTGIADTKVPKPVASDWEWHSLGTDLEREDFSSDDPCDGTPSRGKEGLALKRSEVYLTEIKEKKHSRCRNRRKRSKPSGQQHLKLKSCNQWWRRCIRRDTCQWHPREGDDDDQIVQYPTFQEESSSRLQRQ